MSSYTTRIQPGGGRRRKPDLNFSRNYERKYILVRAVIVKMRDTALPHCFWNFQMACVPGSISHREGSHNSRHHWLWSTSCTEELLELSTSLEPYHHGRCSSLHFLVHVTYQSQLPIWWICKHCVWNMRIRIVDANSVWNVGVRIVDANTVYGIWALCY